MVDKQTLKMPTKQELLSGEAAKRSAGDEYIGSRRPASFKNDARANEDKDGSL
jgi:hypothetical protein